MKKHIEECDKELAKKIINAVKILDAEDELRNVLMTPSAFYGWFIKAAVKNKEVIIMPCGKKKKGKKVGK